MAKTLTIMLMSGSCENEDALFAAKLAEAVLKRGDKVNIYLYGNGVNLSKKDHPVEGDLHIAAPLLEHIESRKAGKRLEEIARMGAKIATCHTNEHARGIQGLEYLEGVKGGDIGHTFCDYLLVSHVFLALSH
jgi:tRNA 2-thiouridine synthesizing protein D